MLQTTLVLGSSGTVALVKLGFILVGGLFVMLFWCFARNEQKKLWPAIAKRLGLAFDGERIHGERAGATIEVGLDTRRVADIRRTFTVVRVTDPRLPAKLQLRAEVKEYTWRFNKDLQTGDAAFDQDVAIAGALDWRTTLLSDAERAVVAAAIGKGWQLEDGALHFGVLGVASSKIEALVEEAETLVDILVERDDDIDRLAARASSGSPGSPEVRTMAFDRMDELFRDRPETVALAQALRDDEVPAIALRAASILVDIRKLAALATAAPVEIPAAIRAAAITELAAYPELARVQQAIARLVGSGPVSDIAPEIAPALAASLAHVPHPRAEAVLIEMLASDAAETVIAATGSLGSVGTITSVMPLMAVRTRPHLARAAIAAIQARAGNAVAGGLMLATDHDGRGALALA